MAAGDQLEGSIREDMGKMESRQGGGSAAADLPRSDAGKGVDAGDTGNGSSSAAAGEKVEKMMARLRLTAAEKTAVVIDDVDDLELVDPDRAFVGKVLSPNVLHLETIKSAMRPAWGNQRGLIFNTAGDNLFVAEFGSQADRDRVMEGSPWKVGKHAVLLKKFDSDVSPLDEVFDRLAIWARIPKLPTRLMRAARGFEIAKPIGIVQKVEADELGRCWGSYMRVRVEVNVNEPLLRYVTVTSSRLQTKRDENGDLPYTAKKLSADDNSKMSGGSSSGTNAMSGGSFIPGSRGSDGSSTQGGRGYGRGAGKAKFQGEDHEVYSSLAGASDRGRGRAGRGRGRGRAAAGGRDLTPAKNAKVNGAGQKRKANKDQPSAPLAIEGNMEKALVVQGQSPPAQVVLDDSSESNKKMKATQEGSADQAAAAEQSRQTQ
ncbi:hypothetical protein QYE76_068520 [Lolium multiflorum]|uniref:DUF4283 domain-containing protein n=1 Tax=Lolium multiflorum TaxID=4521 RepID=A0AAD8SGV6_LOLMU|nr:hypothetical protein QYE76_068520 [Lolium multiflorum]